MIYVYGLIIVVRNARNYVNQWTSWVVFVELLMMIWDAVEMMFYDHNWFHVKIMRFTFVWVFGGLFARI